MAKQNHTPPLREFLVKNHGFSRAAHIISADSKEVLYTLDVPLVTSKHNLYSQTLHLGSSNEGPVVGASRLSFVTWNLKVCFGDPNSQSCAWEKMYKTYLLTYTNYNFKVTLPDATEGSSNGVDGVIGRKTLTWKGTKDVTNEEKSNSPYRMMMKGAFTEHLKLVDNDSGEVWARFVMNPGKLKSGYMGDGIRGRFEILKDHGGQEWDAIVLMSALAMQEFVRKGSWSHGGGSG